ncbi:MAG: hypothetical protein LBB29_00925 [Holosporaceae bacterium]|nr:hypothetical protein [Holosporaceae bacterium]
MSELFRKVKVVLCLLMGLSCLNVMGTNGLDDLREITNQMKDEGASAEIVANALENCIDNEDAKGGTASDAIREFLSAIFLDGHYDIVGWKSEAGEVLSQMAKGFEEHCNKHCEDGNSTSNFGMSFSDAMKTFLADKNLKFICEEAGNSRQKQYIIRPAYSLSIAADKIQASGTNVCAVRCATLARGMRVVFVFNIGSRVD